MRILTRTAVVAASLLAAPTGAAAQEPGVDATAQAAVDAIRARCLWLPKFSCEDAADATGYQADEGSLDGDHARIVAHCGGTGNGGGFVDDRTLDVDLAHCRATAVATGYGQGLPPFAQYYDVYAVTDPPIRPLPHPPGAHVSPDDPAFASTRLALRDRCDPLAVGGTTAGPLRVSPPLLVPPETPTAGAPAAEPAAYFDVMSERQAGLELGSVPALPGHVVRRYETTGGASAGAMLLRTGDYDVYDGTCVSVVHRPTSTFRRVLCSACGAPRRIWIGGDGAVAVVALIHSELDISPKTPLVAVDLERGTAHAVDLAVDEGVQFFGADDVAEAARVEDGALRVRGEAWVAVRLVELLAAMRATSPAPPVPVEPVGAPPSEAPATPASPVASPASAPPAAHARGGCGCAVAGAPAFGAPATTAGVAALLVVRRRAKVLRRPRVERSCDENPRSRAGRSDERSARS